MADLINLSLDGPHTPENTRRVAETAAECIRFLNHATLNHDAEALEFPSDADSVISSLATMAQRLPQLLDQLTGWLYYELQAGRLEVTYGPYAGQPRGAVAAVAACLDDAQGRAGALSDALNAARQVTATIGGVDR